MSMIIKKPGKYVLTEALEQSRGNWEIAVIPAGTVVNVLTVEEDEILTDVFGMIGNVFPLKEIN